VDIGISNGLLSGQCIMHKSLFCQATNNSIIMAAGGNVWRRNVGRAATADGDIAQKKKRRRGRQRNISWFGNISPCGAVSLYRRRQRIAYDRWLKHRAFFFFLASVANMWRCCYRAVCGKTWRNQNSTSRSTRRRTCSSPLLRALLSSCIATLINKVGRRLLALYFPI